MSLGPKSCVRKMTSEKSVLDWKTLRIPGGVAPFETAAHARVFISHGKQDPMLPFKNTAEGIVPGFKARGFDVTFETFNGVHDFRDAEIAKALNWFLAA